MYTSSGLKDLDFLEEKITQEMQLTKWLELQSRKESYLLCCNMVREFRFLNLMTSKSQQMFLVSLNQEWSLTVILWDFSVSATSLQ
jgi:hypothetical protein